MTAARLVDPRTQSGISAAAISALPDRIPAGALFDRELLDVHRAPLPRELAGEVLELVLLNWQRDVLKGDELGRGGGGG